MRKIKSKTYRKILRKEREKNEEKSLSKMEKDDPIQFKEVLKEMEKKRMMVGKTGGLAPLFFHISYICMHLQL